MKKIPTLFERVFENHKIVGIRPKVTPGCLEAFLHGTATVKYDGSCCAILGGVFYKRYDCKKGKTPPEGAIPCCDPDPVTGHWPHWVKVGDGPEDKWFREAFNNTYISYKGIDRTFEAIGPHFQGNAEDLIKDMIIPHGEEIIDNLERTPSAISEFLKENPIEGIVFWLNGEPVCKIKRTDFGYEWPIKEKENV